MGGGRSAEADGPPSDAATATASSRLARLAFPTRPLRPLRPSTPRTPTRAPECAARGRTGDTRTATSWGRRTRSVAAASPGAGAAAARAGPLGPRPRAEAARAPGGPTRVAQRGSPRRFTARTGGTSRHARAGRGRARGEGASPEAAAAAGRRRALPDVGWNAERAAVLVARGGAANEGSSSAFDGESKTARDAPVYRAHGGCARRRARLVPARDGGVVGAPAGVDRGGRRRARGLSNWADAAWRRCWARHGVAPQRPRRGRARRPRAHLQTARLWGEAGGGAREAARRARGRARGGGGGEGRRRWEPAPTAWRRFSRTARRV